MPNLGVSRPFVFFFIWPHCMGSDKVESCYNSSALVWDFIFVVVVVVVAALVAALMKLYRPFYNGFCSRLWTTQIFKLDKSADQSGRRILGCVLGWRKVRAFTRNIHKEKETERKKQIHKEKRGGGRNTCRRKKRGRERNRYQRKRDGQRNR